MFCFRLFTSIFSLSWGQTDCGCSSLSNAIAWKCVQASGGILIVNVRPRNSSAFISLSPPNISALHMHTDCSEASGWRCKCRLSSTSQLCIPLLFCTLRQWDAQESLEPTNMCYSTKQTLSISVCTKMYLQWYDFLSQYILGNGYVHTTGQTAPLFTAVAQIFQLSFE